jgi:hypothetical protein
MQWICILTTATIGIAKSTNTKFLGLIVDNMLLCKEYVDWLMSKLGWGCYAIRVVMTYGIIFWCSSPHSIHIFRLQKRVIIIITNSRSRDSYRELFKKLKTLPLK